MVFHLLGSTTWKFTDFDRNRNPITWSSEKTHCWRLAFDGLMGSGTLLPNMDRNIAGQMLIWTSLNRTQTTLMFDQSFCEKTKHVSWICLGTPPRNIYNVLWIPQVVDFQFGKEKNTSNKPKVLLCRWPFSTVQHPVLMDFRRSAAPWAAFGTAKHQLEARPIWSSKRFVVTMTLWPDLAIP